MVLNEEQWIKELREKRIAYGISQGRLAVASGITREYLNKIESGKMKPSKELLETLHKELARFNPEVPLTMLFDYVKIRFPTLDIQHIIKDILKLNINYMLHEDYGHYSYTEHYSLGDIFIYTSADEEKGVLLELKGRGCRQFESYLLAQQRSWYDFLMDALKNMFKKNKKQTETLKEPKEKKVRTVKVGTHKKTVIALWVVLIASVSFGVYKNFTAIDQHTTHEKEIIELRLQDTNGIENFVKNFAKSYYTWNNSKEAIEARTQAINGYLTKELQDLNVDTIRTDIPTSSTVTDVIVWSIEQSGTDTFSATYEVDQQIKEGEQTSNVKATYTVKVHVDADGDMVIVQNPTLAPAVEKSDYEPKTPEADASVDADTVNDATAFLETFFKLYPTATEKELAYYVSGNVIEPIGRDYLYSELVNPIFTKDGDNVKVKVAVKFLDNQTKATQVSQYELVLHKDSNWKIVG